VDNCVSQSQAIGGRAGERWGGMKREFLYSASGCGSIIKTLRSIDDLANYQKLGTAAYTY